MVAAVAGRTTQLRLGTAVLIAPLRSPVQLAEEAAVVDLVSGGRLELGLGAGYREVEYSRSGADFGARYSALAESVGDIRRAWADPLVSPHPVQRPVPLWLGGSGPVAARRAGRLGTGLLSLDASLVDPYRSALRDAGRTEPPRMSGMLPVYACADPERDWPVVGPLHAAQWTSYFRHAAADPSSVAAVDPERARRAGLRGGHAGLLFGTAADVIPVLANQLAAVPAQTLLVWAMLPDQAEHDAVEHVRYLLAALAPLLRGVGEDSDAADG
jgi:alkanesulfonate monooxygenase SsuD/methylene tetrahydromethanopterin reductase-like flavin-dependent oxidoreductase (luciferase family)